LIAAAAVADYKPKIVATQNKKADDTFVIELEKTKDI
jgi:phosphopantothenoylcysteine synthetase/decarboxylase